MNYKNPVGTYNDNYNSTSSAHVDNKNNIYTQDFANFLQRIQAQYPTTLQEIPLDEPRIQVDLNLRKIDIENSIYKDFLCMAEDHRAETIYFEVDRYFEDVDLFHCTCVVEYINGGDHPRIYPITLKDTFKDLVEDGTMKDKMILAWNIGAEATLYKGDIKFSLMFYKTTWSINAAGDVFDCKIIYALHTTPAIGHILQGMEYSDEQKLEIQDAYTLQTNHYEALLAMINQKNVYWHDL